MDGLTSLAVALGLLTALVVPLVLVWRKADAAEATDEERFR